MVLAKQASNTAALRVFQHPCTGNPPLPPDSMQALWHGMWQAPLASLHSRAPLSRASCLEGRRVRGKRGHCCWQLCPDCHK